MMVIIDGGMANCGHLTRSTTTLRSSGARRPVVFGGKPWRWHSIGSDGAFAWRWPESL
jgi:hypothetical protein